MAQLAKKQPDKSLPTLASELRDLVVGYAKQETLEPLRNLGRFLLWGVAGSVLLALGLLLLALALLRALQDEAAGVFDGRLSSLPYLITFAACVTVAGAAGAAIGRARRRRARGRAR